MSVQHANLIEPFRVLLRENATWKWTSRDSVAFTQLKNNFVNAVTLRHYLAGVNFRLQTDASDVGISGVLYQLDGRGEPRIVSLVSRVLPKCEINYNTTEKELLAIIYSVMKFRTYLYASRFHIVTDHQALTFLLNTPFTTARSMSWTLYLQEYNFTIDHCKGADNIVADFFSRHFPHRKLIANKREYSIRCLNKLLLDKISVQSGRDLNLVGKLKICKDLLQQLKYLTILQGQDSLISRWCQRDSSKFEIMTEQGVIYYRDPSNDGWKLFIPKSLEHVILKSSHEQLGHVL